MSIKTPKLRTHPKAVGNKDSLKVHGIAPVPIKEVIKLSFFSTSFQRDSQSTAKTGIHIFILSQEDDDVCLWKRATESQPSFPWT